MRGRTADRILGLAVVLAATMAVPAAAQLRWPGKARLEAERCRPASGDGAAWLARARAATGMDRVQGAIRFAGTERDVQYQQSDRTYPPFITGLLNAEYTFDPKSGLERGRSKDSGRDMILSGTTGLFVRDTLVAPYPVGLRFFGASRLLNPLAVLADWRDAKTTVVARCTFRDFERVVLSRGVAGERLYLHADGALPVKYERVEADRLWGQVLAEHVYATWWQAGPVVLPIVSVRYVDGVEQNRRDLPLPGSARTQMATEIPLASAWPALPSPLPDHSNAADPMAAPGKVDTVRVDATTFLLVHPFYTHAVTMARDTVFLFDATTAEWRSRADSVWIRTLFPTHRAVVLVVTDLAWPHIEGVRFWAARGAAIATHPISVPFLTAVVNRPWTLAPDARSTGTMRPVRWIPIAKTTALGGGAVRLAPMDGAATEGALMAWVPGAKFLWPGDYIQSSTTPTPYARDVIASAAREGWTPERFAAQHHRLTPWATVVEANRPK